ncbi:MAG: hypothetical protein AAGF76_08950 [Pseudomonadota bacterium]
MNTTIGSNFSAKQTTLSDLVDGVKQNKPDGDKYLRTNDGGKELHTGKKNFWSNVGRVVSSFGIWFACHNKSEKTNATNLVKSAINNEAQKFFDPKSGQKVDPGFADRFLADMKDQGVIGRSSQLKARDLENLQSRLENFIVDDFKDKSLTPPRSNIQQKDIDQLIKVKDDINVDPEVRKAAKETLSDYINLSMLDLQMAVNDLENRGTTFSGTEFIKLMNLLDTGLLTDYQATNIVNLIGEYFTAIKDNAGLLEQAFGKSSVDQQTKEPQMDDKGGIKTSGVALQSEDLTRLFSLTKNDGNPAIPRSVHTDMLRTCLMKEEVGNQDASTFLRENTPAAAILSTVISTYDNGRVRELGSEIYNLLSDTNPDFTTRDKIPNDGVDENSKMRDSAEAIAWNNEIEKVRGDIDDLMINSTGQFPELTKFLGEFKKMVDEVNIETNKMLTMDGQLAFDDEGKKIGGREPRPDPTRLYGAQRSGAQMCADVLFLRGINPAIINTGVNKLKDIATNDNLNPLQKKDMMKEVKSDNKMGVYFTKVTQSNFNGLTGKQLQNEPELSSMVLQIGQDNAMPFMENMINFVAHGSEDQVQRYQQN